MLELIEQIVAEHLGPGDARRVSAWLRQTGEGTRRRAGRRLAAIFDPELRVSEASFRARRVVWRRPLGDIGGKRGAEVGDRLFLNGGQLIDDAFCLESLVHGLGLERSNVLCKPDSAPAVRR
jgi:hypothetical protein